MSDDKNRVEVVPAHHHDDKHPFARGILTGAAVGVGVGLLFAPRTGAQMRHEIGHRWTQARGSCRHAYDVTRSKVAQGAKETRQYVQEVSSAVTRKARKEAQPATKVDFATIAR